MEIRKATVSDCEKLLRLRFDYITEDTGGLNEETAEAIRTQMTDYIPKHINRDFIALLAEDDGQIAATVFLVITEKPANPAFITGKTGMLLNVFTYPAYRRRGIATLLLTKIIDEAKAQNLSYIELSATAMGKPVYEKVGFTASKSKYTAMKLQLI